MKKGAKDSLSWCRVYERPTTYSVVFSVISSPCYSEICQIIHIEIYGENSPREFVPKIASTKHERIELINQDWELVEKDGQDGYFRKAK